MEFISDSITAPIGFNANGIHCGIRKNKSKRDLALILSDSICTAACVYTKNLVKGAPIIVTQQNVSNGYAQAIICNSGNANTCNDNGIEIAKGMCELVAKELDIDPLDVIVASTGVIGQKLSLNPIASHMKELCEGLSKENNIYATEAIMTTDTRIKEAAVSFEINGVECRIGGIAKGSGMIHPNMATMLAFLTTDVHISKEMLQKALSEDVEDTFNMISIDGDTSTNDMVSILANGQSGNLEIQEENMAYTIFKEALNAVTSALSRMIAKDGEGATKLIECKAVNGSTKEICKSVAKSVICSSLVKAAMFGADANWGRILCAIGYSGADVDINRINVSFCSDTDALKVCEKGYGVYFSEEQAKKILNQEEITIIVDLNSGDFEATAYGCDLTYDYVKINGDYRT